MTMSISPPRANGVPAHGSTAGAVRHARRWAAARPQGSAPSCSLKARPAAHPAPAPSWEELLGER